MIKDNGNIRSFGEVGASPVRDMGTNKGRFDLVPLDVMSAFMDNAFLGWVWQFTEIPDIANLYSALEVFCTEAYGGNKSQMMLEVAKHFEEGCNKYGADNWKIGDGIPVWSYIDSTCRHYIKWLDGQNDESHDRAVTWNLMCCIWQVTHNVAVASDHIEEIEIPAENFDEIDFTTIDDLLPIEE